MKDERERRPETPAEADGTIELFSTMGKMLRRLRERAGLTQKEFGVMGTGPIRSGRWSGACGCRGPSSWRRRMKSSMPVGC